MTKILDLIEDRWKDSFRKFIRTGENNKEFLTYLETDENAQRALEAVFEKQEEALSEIAQIIAKSSDT